MQMYRIKSLYGNKLAFELAEQLTDSTRPMLKLAEQIIPTTMMLDQFKGVDAVFKDSMKLSKCLLHHKVICGRKSG